MTLLSAQSGEAATPAARPASSVTRRTLRLPRYARFLLRRAWQSVILVILMCALTFGLINLAPGDMVDVMAGEAAVADAQYLADLRTRYGLDQPLPVRFVNYMEQLAGFDLGYSFRRNTPVLDLILERVGPTVLLMGSSIVFALLGALVLGTVAARTVNRWPDRLISVFALLAYATPVFWIGLMLVLVFSVWLPWLPSSGMETLFSGLTGWARIADIAAHLVLPGLTLALLHLALYTRTLRASLLEVLRQDFVRTARAKGLSEVRVVGVHALGNALLPLVTMVGNQVGSILGGAIVIESVFAWPGLGRLAFEAINERDPNLLMGIVLFSGLLVIAANLLVDLLYGWLDPRIEVR